MKTLESGDKYAVTAFDALDGVAVVSFIDSARGGDSHTIGFWNGPEMSEFISDMINAYQQVFDDDPFI